MSQRSSLFSRTFPASLRAPVRASVIFLGAVAAGDVDQRRVLTTGERRVGCRLLPRHLAGLPVRALRDVPCDDAEARLAQLLDGLPEPLSNDVRRSSLRSGSSG